MKNLNLNGTPVSQLIERFTLVTLGQFKAELLDENATYNKLFREMTAIERELKSRPGDQRIALTALYNHPNPQVRLMAAQATLAVAPAAARQVLQNISDREEWPQAVDANGTLRRLDRGDRRPT